MRTEDIMRYREIERRRSERRRKIRTLLNEVVLLIAVLTFTAASVCAFILLASM